MRRWTACLLLLISTSCATHLGHWSSAANVYTMDRTTLQTTVNTSLARSGWHPTDDEVGRTYVKPGRGGQQTVIRVEFQGAGDRASFGLEGLSDHQVNWLTFGIAGLAGQTVARNTIHAWLNEFRMEHPPADRPPVNP